MPCYRSIRKITFRIIGGIFLFMGILVIFQNYMTGVMLKAMMADWYVNEYHDNPKQKYGDGFRGGVSYRFSIDKIYGNNCVELGAHPYRANEYKAEAAYRTFYPAHCAD